jgi:hypothetical protein
MTFTPRYNVLIPYSLGWCVVLMIAIAGLPWFLLGAVILIQLINTLSVRLCPVRVTIQEEYVHFYFPLARKSIAYTASESESVLHAHPLPLCRFADFMVVQSQDKRVSFFRSGVNDFDVLCQQLKAKIA